MTDPTTHSCEGGSEPFSLKDADLGRSLIASETGHEVTQTLNYLRYLVKSRKSSPLDPEIVGFAVPEIERLERLVEHLRQFKLPALVLTEVALAERLEQCLSRLRESCAKMGVKWAMEVPQHLCVYTDNSYLERALHCLASHSVDNAPPESTITVRAAATDATFVEEISVELTDAGPPLLKSSPKDVFDVWTVHTPESQAARRAIAHRLLRHLGSTLTYEHTSGINVFRFSLPLARGTV